MRYFKNKEIDSEEYSIYLEQVFELYKMVNKNHIADYKLTDKDFISKFYKSNICENSDVFIHEIHVNNENKRISTPKIAFANTIVKESNIISSLRRTPVFDIERYNKLASVLRSAREECVDILLLPEFYIPINVLSTLSRYSEKNQTLIITGLEHIVCGEFAFNFIVSCIPVEVDGIKDSIILFRLKNHYAPHEELTIRGEHLEVPRPRYCRYDLVNWNNIYFTSYYCFELANVFHRSLFKSKIDMLIGVEWNKDTPYFSNIVEASSRDLHVYVAQVNTCQFGDSRLTQPSESAEKDILRLKGGINDTILVSKIDISKLREYQRKAFIMSRDDKNFKPLPPAYELDGVLTRINNRMFY